MIPRISTSAPPAPTARTRPAGLYHFATNGSGYIQDNYKATSRLTLNFGLRLEHYPISKEVNGLLTGWDPTNQAVVLGQPLNQLYASGNTTPSIVNLYSAIGVKFESPEQAGLPATLSHTDKVTFGPRLGFAYKVTDGARPLVVRGGYARYSFPIPARYFVQRSRTNIHSQSQFLVDYSQSVFSPDGQINYMLRNAPPLVAGQGSAGLLDINNPAPVARGAFSMNYFAPNLPAARADEWNITFEREILRNTVARASYIGTHGFHLDQLYDTNQAPSTYVWEKSTGTTPPSSGPFAGVATRLWPTAPYGLVEEYTKNGYSYFSGMSLSVERRFTQGSAFQVFYVFSNATRLGGNGWYDSFAVDPNLFLPGTVPTNFDQLNRLLNYQRDQEIPKHHLRWNWGLVELPFGRGKRLGHDAGPQCSTQSSAVGNSPARAIW